MGANDSKANSSRIKSRGGFSKVWKVIFKKNQKLYALKEMSKVKIIDRKSEKGIKTERDFLSHLHHPFIVNMIYAFQDYNHLYLVMDLLMGGDLRYHLCRKGFFSEEQTKFFIACVLLGLEYIHSNNIIHRDIKPENLVSDGNGYIRITDFGVAKVMSPSNASETSGTPGYMAPEVFCGQSHSFTVDFFAIGIMGYEFMFGERPYQGNNRREIKEAVLSKQIIITNEELPCGWSSDSASFLNSLLARNPIKRLGCSSGIEELKSHNWFNGFNWEDLANKTMLSPFLPKASGNYDQSYCEEVDQIETETIRRYHMIIERDDFMSVFNGYTYIKEQESKSILLQSNRQKLIQQTKFIAIGNMPFNQTSRQINQKSSFIKTRTGLFLNSKWASQRKPNVNYRSQSIPLPLKKRHNNGEEYSNNSRNVYEGPHYAYFLQKNNSNAELPPSSYSMMNLNQSRNVFKVNSIFSLSKQSSQRRKHNQSGKKLVNYRSCRDLGPLLPSLKPTFVKIVPGNDLNENIKSTLARNKLQLPISISTSNRSKSLMKSLSFSLTGAKAIR